MKEAPSLESLGDRVQDLLGFKRLGDVVGGAVFDGFLGHFDGLVAGDDDDGEFGLELFDVICQVNRQL